MSNQIDIAADTAKDRIAAATGTITEFAGTAQDAAVQGINTIRDTAIGTGKQISDTAAKAYQQGTQAADYVSRNTAEQPLLALLLAAAIGYGIAYMMHSR